MIFHLYSLRIKYSIENKKSLFNLLSNFKQILVKLNKLRNTETLLKDSTGFRLMFEDSVMYIDELSWMEQIETFCGENPLGIVLAQM